jgi:hypothetical protein
MSMSCVARRLPWTELAMEPVNMYGTLAVSRAQTIRRRTSAGLTSNAIELPDQVFPNPGLIELRPLSADALRGELSHSQTQLKRNQVCADFPSCETSACTHAASGDVSIMLQKLACRHDARGRVPWVRSTQLTARCCDRTSKIGHGPKRSSRAEPASVMSMRSPGDAVLCLYRRREGPQCTVV